MPHLAEPYTRLAHGIDAHAPGFIDGYGGPPAWADRTLRSLSTLNAEADALEARIGAEGNATRRRFLEGQLHAMRTRLRMLAGETLPYAEEVRGLYGIEALHTPESRFEAALARLDQVLPGTGPLRARQEALRARVAVKEADILALATPILAELRARTAQRFQLPPGEDFSIQLVRGRPWSGYNWPLGNFQSRIDINLDQPVLLPGLPDLLAHEGYPGHHTEHAVKEGQLSRFLGWQEHSLQLINAPECVVSEGIAVNALRAVMDPQELHAWLTGELSRRAGLDPEDVAAELHAAAAREALAGVSGNAALLLHAQGRPQAEVLDYLTTYSLHTPERARQSLSFLEDSSFRAYIFTYSVGGELVRAALARGAVTFWELLSEPLTPGQLAG